VTFIITRILLHSWLDPHHTREKHIFISGGRPAHRYSRVFN